MALLESNGLELHYCDLDMIWAFQPSNKGRLEMGVIYNIHPLLALVNSFDNPDCELYAVIKDHEVLAIVGISEGDVLWAQFSLKMKKHWRAFVRASRDLINFFNRDLEAHIWGKNTDIVNWLVWLGFSPQMLYNRTGSQEHMVELKYLQDTHSSCNGDLRPVKH